MLFDLRIGDEARCFVDLSLLFDRLMKKKKSLIKIKIKFEFQKI